MAVIKFNKNALIEDYYVAKNKQLNVDDYYQINETTYE